MDAARYASARTIHFDAASAQAASAPPAPPKDYPPLRSVSAKLDDEPESFAVGAALIGEKEEFW